MGKLPVAIQVYSVRGDAEKDFKGTIKQLKEMGYEGIELAGLYGHTAAEISDILSEVGMAAVSAHVPMVDLMNDTEKVIDDYILIGCKYIAVPYLNEDMRPGSENFDKVLSEIKRIGEVCVKKGITLLYHNHDFEFVKLPDGMYGLDKIYSEIPSNLLKSEIDTCWVSVSGVDPSEYIRKYSGRCPVVHLKDYYIEGKKPEKMYGLIGLDDDKPAESGFFRPIGKGVQNFPEIITAAKESGAKWLVVEQDESTDRPPMEAAKISIEYVKKVNI